MHKRPSKLDNTEHPKLAHATQSPHSSGRRGSTSPTNRGARSCFSVIHIALWNTYPFASFESGQPRTIIWPSSWRFNVNPNPETQISYKSFSSACVTRRTSRGSGNSSLKHVGEGHSMTKVTPPMGISESELEDIVANKPPPPGASGLSLIRNVHASPYWWYRFADEHNLSLMGGGSSDEHLIPTPNRYTTHPPDLEPSPETDSDTNTGPNSTLATWKPDTIPLPRTDSKSSVGTAKPSSLHPGNASPHSVDTARKGAETASTLTGIHRLRRDPIV
ncbi:WD domain, G-beta repeat protein [Rhizoctonia solani]|uniref:WD domain, G-beta repeat protein n=1 Tax=Rhizoctonia solani TaxID=456999 RepID=A0A8H8SZP0_9AGAM|nr:WD domain, G-beta repeat protein [Rhizoctonia solani]QRW24506.1 WD domain, G-beta repeat protein [Rhizoctonia solani]